MSTGTLAPEIKPQFFDANGDPLAAGTIDFYAAGTTTRQDTFSDVGLTTPNANPVVLDSAGRPSSGAIYFTPGTSYKAVLKNSAGATQWTQDNVTAVPVSNVDVDVTGTAGEALAATEVCYLSDGSGGQTVGRWYKADSDLVYASHGASLIGIATAAISSGASGAIRLMGRLTGFVGLTIGADYYISATAGGVTATAPTAARFLGRADSLTSLVLAPNPMRSLVNPGICEGRLTLTSGTPVTTGDVSAATSCYWTPFRGNQIALYTGGIWVLRTFSELTLSLVGLTASKPYDVFAYDNAGVAAIEALVWTDATTRATALTTQDGVLVKSGATTRRYLGTIYINATGGQTDDTAAKRYVWNYTNRVPRKLQRFETTDSWTYTTSTWRQANGAAANQLDFVIGVAEVVVSAKVGIQASNSSAGVPVGVAIGLDSTSTPAADCVAGVSRQPASQETTLIGTIETIPTAGRHVLVWLERSNATGTTTWAATNTGSVSFAAGGGLSGAVWG